MNCSWFVPFPLFDVAAKVIYEADRHAKKELKKHVRGIRQIEQSINGRDEPTSEVVRGYCLAIRGSLTNDGRPPRLRFWIKTTGTLKFD